MGKGEGLEADVDPEHVEIGAVVRLGVAPGAARRVHRGLEDVRPEEVRRGLGEGLQEKMNPRSGIPESGAGAKKGFRSTRGGVSYRLLEGRSV